jgi:hypothetical protein
MLTFARTYQPHQFPLGRLAVGLVFAALGVILDRGVAMRAELGCTPGDVLRLEPRPP